MSLHPAHPKILYHGTSVVNTLSIQEDGTFRPSLSGMLGRGVYGATTLQKAINYAQYADNFGGIVLTIEVNNMGNVVTLSTNDPRMQSWHSQYDAAYSPEHTNGERAEYCIKDPTRIKIVGIQAGDTSKIKLSGYTIEDNKLISHIDIIEDLKQQLKEAKHLAKQCPNCSPLCEYTAAEREEEALRLVKLRAERKQLAEEARRQRVEEARRQRVEDRQAREAEDAALHFWARSRGLSPALSARLVHHAEARRGYNPSYVYQ